MGYIRNVTPTKVSKKGNQYFSFEVQQKERVVKAVCFSPQKHKAVVESQEERGSPCKITRFSPHVSENNTIWINPNTQINDAMETAIHFTKDECLKANAAACQTRNLNEIQVHQSVSIRGYIVFGDRQAEQIPSKKELTKREGCLVDEFGNVPITLWNDQAISISPGYYDIEKIRIRQFMGIKYISSSPDTTFTKISDDPPPSITAKSVQDAIDSLKLDELICDGKIISANVQIYYSCLSCSKRVLYQQEKMLRCGSCQTRFLVKNASKTTAVKLAIKDDQDLKSYTLFTPTLEAILLKHNAVNDDHRCLTTIDEDMLCEIILSVEGLKLKLDKGNVIGCEFV